MTGARTIVTLGEALIDLVALEPGIDLGIVHGFARAVGGAPANVAVGIARLGGRAAFVGRVGDDPFGRAIVGELRRAGVDVSAVAFDHARTALAFVALGADGEREFLFFRDGAADTHLAPTDIPVNVVRGAAALHVGTVSLSVEPAAAATRRALDLARDADVVRSCDLNLRPALWEDPARMCAAASELIAMCEIVKASAEEAREVTGEADAIRAAHALVRSGPRIAVVTCGPAGATVATREGAAIVPGFFAHVVDATGAGDAFMAALLVELARADRLRDERPALLPVADAVRVANAAGALAVQRRGAIPALPARSEIDALLERPAVVA